MLPSGSAIWPADVLRQSSDQSRRVAQVLAEITDEAAACQADRFAVSEIEELNALRQSTIQQAQRSFSAALRLAQQEDPR